MRRFDQTTTLEHHLTDEAQNLRKRAKLLPEGQERDSLLRKARQAEIRLRLAEWLTSPGLPHQNRQASTVINPVNQVGRLLSIIMGLIFILALAYFLGGFR
jgi:hypothetical protein